MQTAIERLRASKEAAVVEDRDDGLKAGREWATNDAEYAELLRISRISEELLRYPDHAYEALRKAVVPMTLWFTT
jgi:hypothetical protein